MDDPWISMDYPRIPMNDPWVDPWVFADNPWIPMNDPWTSIDHPWNIHGLLLHIQESSFRLVGDGGALSSHASHHLAFIIRHPSLPRKTVFSHLLQF